MDSADWKTIYIGGYGAIIRSTHKASSRIGLPDGLSDSSSELIFEENILAVPGMVLNVLNGEPLLDILVEHPHDEVLELVGQLAGAVGVPESSGVAVQGPVVDVLRLGGFERQEARRHYEENNARRKDVSVLPVEFLVGLDFGTHVSLSPDLPVDEAGAGGTESEVGNFERVGLVQEQILSFDVQMSDSAVVDVLDRFDELVEVGPRHDLAESLALLDQLIDFVVGGVLHNHDLAVGLAAGGGVLRQFAVVLIPDDVRVVKHPRVVVLRFRELRRLGLEQLYGKILALVLRQVDVRAVA